jgi:pyrroloquinoline quinone (PQQ) biosynthesis protein C
MDGNFVRSGSLMDARSYPTWLQAIIHECTEARRGVADHEIFQMLREDALPQAAMRHFLAGVWPVIEQFPQYMAMNLVKVQHGSRGHELARKYLIRNIRVEQNHVEYWTDWAQAHAVSRDDLLSGWRSGPVDALSHWCWHTCERDPLAVAMAATNYAIEGVTGEWAAGVCSSEKYESGFPPEQRKKAMKWLRVHAHYDDTHPWEALEIIATIMGNQPSARDVDAIQVAVLKSYGYMQMAFDDCLTEDRAVHALGSSPAAIARIAAARNLAH